MQATQLSQEATSFSLGAPEPRAGAGHWPALERLARVTLRPTLGMKARKKGLSWMFQKPVLKMEIQAKQKDYPQGHQSLFLACTQDTSDPEKLRVPPVLPWHPL